MNLLSEAEAGSPLGSGYCYGELIIHPGGDLVEIKADIIEPRRYNGCYAYLLPILESFVEQVLTNVIRAIDPNHAQRG